jgi:hypothetical protein
VFASDEQKVFGGGLLESKDYRQKNSIGAYKEQLRLHCQTQRITRNFGMNLAVAK